MHLLQVCNVGEICGGTAACAWEITQALPTCRHTVAFLSGVTSGTRKAFEHCSVLESRTLGPQELQRLDPDVVLLHNTSADRVAGLTAPLVVQYLHSKIRPAAADITVACSEWLAAQYSPQTVDAVLYQPISLPHPVDLTRRQTLSDRLTVGRLCTPSPRKWPRELIPFYRRLAQARQDIDWEFVGCPEAFVDQLHDACGGRASFLPASREARLHLWRWDVMLYHHPTLTESFGRTATESLQAGCIPIVDDRGGFREQVHPRCGFLCRDVHEFERSLGHVQHRQGRRQLSRHGRATAMERFSLDAFAVRFRRVLEAVSAVIE